MTILKKLVMDFNILDFKIPDFTMEDINWLALLGIVVGTLFTIAKKIAFVAITFYGFAILNCFFVFLVEIETVYVFLILIVVTIPEILPWILFAGGFFHIVIGMLHYLFENYTWP